MSMDTYAPYPFKFARAKVPFETFECRLKVVDQNIQQLECRHKNNSSYKEV